MLPKPVSQPTLESALRRAEERIHLRRELRASQEALRRQNERLEAEVKARTAELEREIEERKQAHRDLQESESRYRSLFANNHAIMLLIDPDTGAIVDANPAACAYYGYTREELTACTISQINTLSEAEVFQEIARAKNASRQHFLFRHRLASGDVRDVEVYSGPILVQGKQLLYSIINDVTERKRMEEALQQSEQKYRYLFENAPIGIFHTSFQGHPLSVNAAMAHMLGLDSPEEAVAHYSDLGSQLYVHPERRDQFVQKLRADGFVENFEYEARTADGRIIWLSMNARLESSGENGALQIEGFTTDITERKHAEE